MVKIKIYDDNIKLKKEMCSAKEETKFFAVKREKISVQFNVHSDKKVIVEAYSVSVDSNVDIPCELFIEEYLSFEKASNQFLTPGTYPDALLPFEHAVKHKYNVIEADDERTFLLRMTIPEEYNEGDYTVRIQFVISGETHELEFSLHVYDICLPKQNHCKALFSIFKDAGWLSGTESEQYEQYKDCYEMLAEYRVSGTYLPIKSIEIDNARIKDVIEAVKIYANDKRIACYSLNYKTKKDNIGGQEFTVIDREYFKALLVALVENSTDECNLLNNCVLYMATVTDEPTPDRFPQIRRAYDDVYQIKREVAKELDFTGKHEVEKSLLTFDNIITCFHKEPVYGGIDTWCPTFWGYSFPEYRYEAKQLTHLGFKHWFYGCLSPQTPFPVYMIDEQLYQIKAVNWMMFDHNVDGNLYWAVNCCYRKGETYYNNPVDGNEIISDFHGDGYLIYNKEVYGTLAASLRLNAVMEGNQDYEKLLIYRKLFEQLTLDYAVEADCKKILRPYLDKMYEGSIVSEDIHSVYQAEYALNELIELANKGIILEKLSVQNGIAKIAVYLPKKEMYITKLTPVSEEDLCNGVKLIYELSMEQKKNFFDFIVENKSYSLFIGEKVTVIPQEALIAKGNKITITKYGDTSAVLVSTQPFLNSEKESTEFAFDCMMDATRLDRLYFEIESVCDFECIVSATLIDKEGKEFCLGYDMVEERTNNVFSVEKQWRVIKELNNADALIEGYHQKEKYEEKFREFDFEHVESVRFNVLNNTKLLDENRERRTPEYTFIINSVYYSENYEEEV